MPNLTLVNLKNLTYRNSGKPWLYDPTYILWITASKFSRDFLGDKIDLLLNNA